MRTLRITPDGVVSVLEARNFDDIRLAIRGWAESRTMEDGVLYSNEDGKMLGMDFNPVATEVSGINKMGDFYVGTVVVVGPTDRKGEDTPITEACEARIRRIAEANK